MRNLFPETLKVFSQEYLVVVSATQFWIL